MSDTSKTDEPPHASSVRDVVPWRACVREGLSLADSMVDHPDVSLIVVQFLAEYRGDIESERKLDDGVVTWFWVKHERNDKVVYKEIMVNNGLETVSAIQSLNDSVPIDLWIVRENVELGHASIGCKYLRIKKSQK